MDRLINERSISLGYSLDTSTFGTYTSALNSYLTFCNLHHLPADPTPDTLSFFIVFLSSHISPKSVNSYLSGICRQLEPFYPDVRRNRKTVLVSRTMAGCMRRFGTPVKRKSPLSHADLQLILDRIGRSSSHDDLLFRSQLLTGFHGLLRLGELVFPDKKILRNYRKISLRHTVRRLSDQFSFFLPSHKGDRVFEGNTIVIQKVAAVTDPYAPFFEYLSSRDHLYPLHPELWLTSRGTVPTRHWFLSHLRTYLPTNFAGHSLRSGGATSLAEAGVDLSIIQAAGRWSSDAFQIYIRKNPVVLHAVLFGRPAHQPPY
jgi:integrase